MTAQQGDSQHKIFINGFNLEKRVYKNHLIRKALNSGYNCNRLLTRNIINRGKGRIIKKASIIMLFCFLIASLFLACSEKTSTSDTTENTTQTTTSEHTTTTAIPDTGNWFDKFGKPRYGGEIVIGVPDISVETDPWSALSGGVQNFYMETLWMPSWSVDRDIFPFSVRFTPPEYYEGLLAESWEMVDPQTLNVYLRQGIHWQDKPPVNGREFVAADVKEYFDRICAFGKYDTPSRQKSTVAFLKEINVIDKYTVQFKYEYPSATGILVLQNCFSSFNYIPPPELYTPDAEGNLPIVHWENGVGTGPWIIDNFIAGNSAVFSRNPNYWGYDERHPENQLPYADKLKIVDLPDLMTKLSALRTGKIDIVDGIPWQQANILKKSNPELEYVTSPNAAETMLLVVDKDTPFTDIKVRKAMQLSLDIKAIGESYYGGTAEKNVCGLIHPIISKTGWGFSYDEWPDELKAEYSYNPEKARELLSEAGYPDGFNMNVVAGQTSDFPLIEIFKAYFAEVGINMDIIVMDSVSSMALAGSRQIEYAHWDRIGGSGIISQVTHPINAFQSTNRRNSGGVNDPYLDSLVDEFYKAQSMERGKELVKEIDRYVIGQHWSIYAVPINTYNFWRPSLRGYTAEPLSTLGNRGWLLSRLWKSE